MVWGVWLNKAKLTVNKFVRALADADAAAQIRCQRHSDAAWLSISRHCCLLFDPANGGQWPSRHVSCAAALRGCSGGDRSLGGGNLGFMSHSRTVP